MKPRNSDTSLLAAAARARTGLSQGDFAKLIRAGERTVQNWESGTKPPNPTTQLMLEEIRDGWLPSTRE